MIEDEFDVDFADTFCSQDRSSFTLRKPSTKCETGVRRKQERESTTRDFKKMDSTKSLR